MLVPFLGVKNMNMNIFGVSRIINIFGGMKTLWILFWGNCKIGLYMRVISKYFRVFS